MDTPMTMDALIERTTTQDAVFTEIPLEHDELRFDPEGIRYNGDLIRTDRAARALLFEKVGAPGRYLTKLSPALQAAALNEHAAGGDFGSRPTLVMDRQEFVTIIRGEVWALPNSAVIRAVGDAVEGQHDGLFVSRIRNDIERLDVEPVSPSRQIAVRPGDIVQSGLHIVHERFGVNATIVEGFMLRLVCTNGMTRRECVGDGEKRPRTRKLPADFPNSRELQIDQIRRLAQRNWNLLGSQLEALQQTRERSTDVQQLLTRYLQRGRISVRNMLPRLLEAWRTEGAERTHYGAVNALTRIATHDHTLSRRQRRMVASLAGVLAFSEVHICEHCFSVLGTDSAA